MVDVLAIFFLIMEQAILIVFYIITLVYSIIFHEVSHGVVALWLGDKTAKYSGRLSLEPLRHIDPIGSIILPLFMILTTGFAFGWAKPVPYNPYNLRWPKWGAVVVAFAGPVTNFILAISAAVVASFINISIAQKYTIVTHLMSAQWSSLVSVVVGSPLLIAYTICTMIVFWNVLLGTFNLMPIPPLDGSKLVFAIFDIPQRAQMFLEQWGFFILIFILFTPLAVPFHLILRTLWDIFFKLSF
ncbi:MAG TPA: site-2 protease family protein [Candidatus Pacebacteria bacterium]|nr:site-2 protease family protein [Candidatus Paceibacterota bacterium]